MHLQLSSEGGGDVSPFIRDGRLRAAAQVPRPRTAVLTLPADLLLDLLGGCADFSSAQLSGCEGEGHAAMLLAGMVRMFRSALNPRGPTRWLARALHGWMSGERAVQPQDR